MEKKKILEPILQKCWLKGPILCLACIHTHAMDRLLIYTEQISAQFCDLHSWWQLALFEVLKRRHRNPGHGPSHVTHWWQIIPGLLGQVHVYVCCYLPPIWAGSQRRSFRTSESLCGIRLWIRKFCLLAEMNKSSLYKASWWPSSQVSQACMKCSLWCYFTENINVHLEVILPV